MTITVGVVGVGDRPITYRRAGQGPPLVLLHGGWSDSREWRLQLEGLCDRFTVVAWDAPGCGGSWDPPDDFPMSAYADMVAGFVRALDLARPHLLGLSFGGGLAIEVSHRHPGLPRSLVLASAYAGWAGSLPADVVAERLHRVIEEADRPPAEWASAYLPGFFAGPVPQSLADELLGIMCDARPAGIKPMMKAFAEADLRPWVPEIAVPTLLLYGERDERSPLTVAADLHSLLPSAQLAVIPGVGHVSNVEAPEAFNSEVARFLLAVDSRGGAGVAEAE